MSANSIGPGSGKGTRAAVEQRALDNMAFICVKRERVHQIEKWGDERQGPDYTDNVGFGHAHESSILARSVCQAKFAAGKGSYADILREEVAEAIDEAALGNTDNLRAELVQVAAVAVAWIQLLDREAVNG